MSNPSSQRTKNTNNTGFKKRAHPATTSAATNSQNSTPNPRPKKLTRTPPTSTATNFKPINLQTAQNITTHQITIFQQHQKNITDAYNKLLELLNNPNLKPALTSNTTNTQTTNNFQNNIANEELNISAAIDALNLSSKTEKANGENVVQAFKILKPKKKQNDLNDRIKKLTVDNEKINQAHAKFIYTLYNFINSKTGLQALIKNYKKHEKNPAFRLVNHQDISNLNYFFNLRIFEMVMEIDQKKYCDAYTNFNLLNINVNVNPTADNLGNDSNDSNDSERLEALYNPVLTNTFAIDESKNISNYIKSIAPNHILHSPKHHDYEENHAAFTAAIKAGIQNLQNIFLKNLNQNYTYVLKTFNNSGEEIKSKTISELSATTHFFNPIFSNKPLNLKRISYCLQNTSSTTQAHTLIFKPKGELTTVGNHILQASDSIGNKTYTYQLILEIKEPLMDLTSIEKLANYVPLMF